MIIKPYNSNPHKFKILLHGKSFTALNFVLLTICFSILGLYCQNYTANIDHEIYDNFLVKKTQKGLLDRILIIDIDEKTLSTEGQWPWPRYKIAEVIKHLKVAGVKVIGFDMIFPEKDRTSLPVIQENLLKDLNFPFEYVADGTIPDNDKIMAEAISEVPTVLGFQFNFQSTETSTSCDLSPLKVSTRDNIVQPGSFPIYAKDVTCNLALFSRESERSGFLNVAPDNDGIFRDVPLVIAHNGQFYPSLALALVLSVHNTDNISLARNYDTYNLQIGARRVTLDSKGRMLVQFHGKAKTFPYISGTDLLDGSVPSSDLKDKIVIIGTSAAGLNELRATPLDPLMPGMEIQATIVSNLLSGKIIYKPAGSIGIELFLSMLCGISYLVLTRNTNAVWGLISVITGCAILLIASFQLFKLNGMYISPTLALFVLFGNFVFLNIFKHWRKDIEARKQNRELLLAQGAIIEAMASLTETRHAETGEHIIRTQKYVAILTRALQNSSTYRNSVDDEFVKLLCKTAPLHDIGKVGIADSILLKEGPLTREEFNEIKTHTTIGRDIIIGIRNRIGSNLRFLEVALEVVYTHHEKWDGSGYPQGLKREQIPISGRIMAIVDMYDALTSKRVYKEEYSHEKAISIMKDCAEASFDPGLFSIFIDNSEKFKDVIGDGQCHIAFYPGEIEQQEVAV